MTVKCNKNSKLILQIVTTVITFENNQFLINIHDEHHRLVQSERECKFYAFCNYVNSD